MNRFANSRDRFWLRASRVCTAAAVAMLIGSAVSTFGGLDQPVLAAPIFRDAVTLSPTSGGSGAFNITLPAGAACQGSGASGYKWETYLVSASVDVAALTFTDAPNPVAGATVVALFDTTGTQVSNKFPSASPVGLISGIPQISFEQTVASTVGTLPVGSYKIGIACTFVSGPGTPALQDYWMTQIAVTADVADTPLGIHWALEDPPESTTTVAETTTTVAVTSTTQAGTSTTSAPTSTTSAPTSTTAASTSTTSTSTTTTLAVTTTTSRNAAAPPVAAATTSSVFVSTLAATGSPTVPLAIWAILLLVIGRLIVLIARPLRVRPPNIR